MKIRPLCAFAIFAATVAPAIANAQAPAGVARVDSDTYFDTSNSDTNYGEYQNDFVDYPGERESSWFDFATTSSTHGGLLGKTYVRGAYLYNGVDDTGGIDFDALEGWDAEFNAPIPWISSDTLAADFIAEFEHRQIDAAFGTTRITSEGRFFAVGIRLIAMPDAWFRPFVSLGASFQEFKFQATGIPTSKEDEEEFVSTIGIEADIASNASIRGEFEIDRDDIDESTFETTVVLWLGDHFFFRGGGVIPLDDDLDPGVTIGGGVAFR